jgi:hypothetical protein
MFELLAYERFRDTPSVRFFDVTVDTSNARDLVIHSGPAVSPPNDPESGAWQFYLHPHQEDNLLAASGGRTFFLVNLAWEQPFTSFGSRAVVTSFASLLAPSTARSPIPMVPSF